jgi:hypothetical protein
MNECRSTRDASEECRRRQEGRKGEKERRTSVDESQTFLDRSHSSLSHHLLSLAAAHSGLGETAHLMGTGTG